MCWLPPAASGSAGLARTSGASCGPSLGAVDAGSAKRPVAGESEAAGGGRERSGW
ncbi:hypothetical protein [Paenibacillus ferrarius]|uniref:hypothetical protein n=1 Tax=Paenibacillus ferrarius TaxID=1469647 RepID=UPI001301FA16|nr:hypothetical protein [Paenibacillus ferrarius]